MYEVSGKSSCSNMTANHYYFQTHPRPKKHSLDNGNCVDALLARQRGDSGYGDASVAKKITVIEILIIS